MKRQDAIKQAQLISGRNKRVFVIFDNEGQDFYVSNEFYEPSPYEIIKIFE
jgi:hypothetical protein